MCEIVKKINDKIKTKIVKLRDMAQGIEEILLEIKVSDPKPSKISKKK